MTVNPLRHRPAPDESAAPEDGASPARATDHAVTDRPADDAAPASSASTSVPWLALAAIVMVLVPLRGAIGPIRDINDVHWHILLGQEVLSGTPVTASGHGWSFAPVPDTWVSTQWLAEVLFGWLEQVGGLRALLVYRAVTTVAVLVVLALVTLVRRPPRASVWVFTLGAVAVAFTTQERSQQLTFLLAPLVGWWALSIWEGRGLPRWWFVLPVALVWSNFHGGWVLLPLTLALAALARMVDQGVRDRLALRALALSAGTVVMAALSPSGVDNALAMVRFSQATQLINEWQPVTVWSVNALPITLMVLTVVVSWAVGRVRPSRGELVLVLATVVLGFVAWRNVTPTVLILAPLVVGTLARALGEPDPDPRPVRLGRTTIVVSVIGGLVALVAVLFQTPVEDSAVPLRLLDDIARTTADQRVLDTFNMSGPVLWFGGRPPHVTVAVDGRADRYGGDFITRYNDTLSARSGWQQQVDQLAPTAALLRTDEALGGALVAERGWIEVGREGGYVLLRAPHAPGW